MPSFKPKNIKNIIVPKKNIATLDSKHKEMTELFKNENMELLPQLKKERSELKLKLNVLSLSTDEKLDIQDRLKELKKIINEITKKEKDYFLNNSKYIFDYFENKKKIADSLNNNKNSILDDFFKVKKNTLDERAEIGDFENNNNTNNTSNVEENLNMNMNKERTSVQKYLANIDETFLDINSFVVQTDICRSCNKGEMIPIDHEGVLVCNACSKSIPYLIENEKPSYKEPPKEVCFYAYKRINHFREILAQFQAKETTQIPDEVIENIKQQIKKERIGLHQLNNKRAKDILKKLGYNKYYEHIPFIKDKLGIKPPIMSSDLEDTLCNLFMEIQGPYAKYCPDDRVNFLNYYYTIYKLCELLDQKQFLPYFPMLKDREKRIEQDEIWRNICAELDWEYIPTV
jgi:hypothetical protein